LALGTKELTFVLNTFALGLKAIGVLGTKTGALSVGLNSVTDGVIMTLLTTGF
jgi:hypothetical protein